MKIWSIISIFRDTWWNCLPWMVISSYLADFSNPCFGSCWQFTHTNFLQDETHKCLWGMGLTFLFLVSKNNLENFPFCFQYLELRYQSRAVRLLASSSYIISIILYMGVVLYAPCLALHTITNLSIISLILIGGVVGTIYTVMVKKVSHSSKG